MPISRGSFGNCALAFRVKESLGFEHGLETHELLVQNAFARRPDLICVQLVLSAGVVHTDLAVYFDGHAIFERETQPRRAGLPHDAAQGRA